jgi:hypothetical protein
MTTYVGTLYFRHIDRPAGKIEQFDAFKGIGLSILEIAVEFTIFLAAELIE